jgi:NAD(P)H dehydrogenase (quinone)
LDIHTGDQMSVSVVVAYHSGFGHTKKLAEAVLGGAGAVGGVEASILPVLDLGDPGPKRNYTGRWQELNDARAIIFGCPTYMGSVSSDFKRFMEYSSGIWYQQLWKDKIAGGFINSGGLSGDKLNSMLDLVVFAGQHSMIWVSQGVMPSIYTGDKRDLNRLGSWLGSFSSSGQEPPEVAPPKSDRDTAELYGKRIAELAIKMPY